VGLVVVVSNPLSQRLLTYPTVRINTKREEREAVIMAVLACGRGGGRFQSSRPGTAKKAGLLNLFLFHAAQDSLVGKKET
jgi:hypothetical protein